MICFLLVYDNDVSYESAYIVCLFKVGFDVYVSFKSYSKSVVNKSKPQQVCFRYISTYRTIEIFLPQERFNAYRSF